MASFEIKLLPVERGRKDSFPLYEVYLLMTVSSKFTLNSFGIFFSSSLPLFAHIFYSILQTAICNRVKIDWEFFLISFHRLRDIFYKKYIPEIELKHVKCHCFPSFIYFRVNKRFDFFNV